MELIDVPTELTTAATDAVLALVGFGCVLTLWRTGRGNPWRASVWSLAIGLVSLAAGLGAFAHGLKISPQTKTLLWQPLNLALGFTMALFIVGVVGDLWGRKAAWRVLPGMVAIALGFYLLTVLVPGLFVFFALLELSVLVTFLLALGTPLNWPFYHYIPGIARSGGPGRLLILSLFSLSLLAALIQMRHQVAITIVWPLDHNGVFHLVQIPGLVVLTAGLRAGFCRPATER